MKDKIIVVEDNSELLELLQTLLSSEGYQVKSKLSADGLLKEVEQYQPDLLLMDLWIEPVNADSFVKQIRQQEKYRDLPILLVSAADNLEEVAQECGATAFVKKPFDFGFLVDQMEACLNGQGCV